MYEEYYGLISKPFQLSPDPRFFYASQNHRRAMLYMQYGLEQAEGFIVISGPVGTGKSTLARNLINQIANTDLIACQLVTTNLNAEELIQAVASGFGLSCESHDKFKTLKRLENYLIELHHQNKRALLLVDEAQNLPAESIEELRMLSNFQLGDKPLLQSFLLGQEELRDTLQSPNMEQFRQRIIASCHLSPLTSEETRAYIEHRLKQVGWQGSPTIDSAAHASIYAATLGVPRKINRLCDRVLLAGYLNETQSIDEALVTQTADEITKEMPNAAPTSAAVDTTVQVQDPPPNVSRPITPPQKSVQQEMTARAPCNDDAITRLELHLQAVYHYLDSTLERKLQMVRYLDKNIAKKTEHYNALKRHINKLEPAQRERD
jgi:putative secretion ATPase (PEP-CTERM system associated)